MTSSIRSRKHAVNPYALLIAAAAITLPSATLAGEDDMASTNDQSYGPTEVTIKGDRKVPYKTDQSANRKATADVLDTPQTVQVIGEQIISEQGATTLTEAMRNSPGVGTFYLGENGSTSTGDAVYMRGSDVSNSIFVDGVRDVASVSRDVFNIESVEVLKGAAGADIGRGSATGAINLISKHPHLRDAFSASIAAGGGDYVRATADANWQIGNDSAVRLNVIDQDAGVPGRDALKNKRWGIAGSAGFGLRTHTRVFIDAMHVTQNNIPDGGVFTIGMPGYSSPDPTNRAYISTAPRVDPSHFYGTKDDHEKIGTDVVTATIEHDFNPDLRLTNVTRRSQTNQDYQLSSFTAATANFLTPSATDRSTWTILRNINNKDVTNTMVTNQTNLQARARTWGLNHSISTGIEFISEEQKTYLFAATAAATTGLYPAISVYAPNANVSGYTRTLTGAYTLGKTDTTGLYINDTIHFSPAWLLSAGLRFDHYKTDYDQIGANGQPSVTRLVAEDDLWSGKLGLTYKPTPNGSLYASYAVTVQPPGGVNFTLSSTTTAGVNNPDVAPQTSETREAGAKWSLLHNRLNVNGSIYKTDYSDQVVLDTDGTYYRTGEKSVRGIEVNMVGQITPAWNVSAGYTTMKTEVKGAPVVAADGSTQLTYNPSDSFTLWTTYAASKRLTFGGGARYNGELKRGTDGAVGTPKFTKSYVVFDGVAKYHLTRRAELQLNAYNLFDKDYVGAINKSGYRYTPGTPRTFRLTMNLSY